MRNVYVIQGTAKAQAETAQVAPAPVVLKSHPYQPPILDGLEILGVQIVGFREEDAAYVNFIIREGGDENVLSRGNSVTGYKVCLSQAEAHVQKLGYRLAERVSRPKENGQLYTLDLYVK